jgi:hypothetical protein
MAHLPFYLKCILVIVERSEQLFLGEAQAGHCAGMWYMVFNLISYTKKKPLGFSESQFPYLENGSNSNSFFMGC